ncbi:hypothetical protein ACFE04_031073 [Oxalis oulophora]
MDAKVSSMFIYPIKSCRGISVSQALLTPTGFRWDRNWVVINSRGRMYTQRNEPKLALIQVQMSTEAFSEGWEPTNNSYMVLKAPGQNELKVCLAKPPAVADGVSVWEWSGSALDEGDEAANWLTNYLGKPSRLVRFNAVSEKRPVDPEFARGHNVMFSDLFPYMIASQASLDTLNQHLKEPVPINRFRPNILVDGCGPFDEDLWTEIRISKFTFQGVRLCSRCKVIKQSLGTYYVFVLALGCMKKYKEQIGIGLFGSEKYEPNIPTIDQATGVAGSEPNETLMKIRSDKVLRPNRKQQGKIYFGQNLVCKDNLSRGKGNIMKIGDPVAVLKKVSSVADATV